MTVTTTPLGDVLVKVVTTGFEVWGGGVVVPGGIVEVVRVVSDAVSYERRRCFMGRSRRGA
jgi:uncharacterized protein YacL